MNKSKQPVMLGTLKVGKQFIFNARLWEVQQQNPGRKRKPDEGMARCKQINTPVISNLVRSNYVVPV